MQPIPGFEEYLISTSGDIFSIKSKRFLSQKIDRYGYPTVVLVKHHKPKYVTVHRLVAMTFLPQPQGKCQVNHKNEVKTDNRVENLEWVSAKENCNYGTRNRRMAESKCQKPVMHFSEDGTVTRYSGVKEASRETGIAHSQITRYCRGVGNSPKNKEWRYADGMA